MNKSSLLLGAALALVLSGCSYMPSWLGGEKAEAPKLPGERFTVLPVEENLKPDESLKAIAMTLPPVNDNANWAQHTGMVNSRTSNLGAPGNFDHITHAGAGKGEEFDHTLIPRPVVADGLVFSMDAVGNISARDAADIKKLRWESKGVSEEDEPEIIGGGLAWDAGKLYAVSGRGIVAAFDSATGKPLWNKAIRLPFRSAPKVAGDKLLAITIDNQTFAFNTANGDVVWSQRGIDETAGILNTVSPTVDGEMVIVPYSSGEVYALSLSEGKELWTDSLLQGAQTQAGTVFAGIGGDPVVDGEVVFAVSNGGALSVLTLGHGQGIWERPVPSVNTPWVSGDYLFVLGADNTLVCLVKFTGAVRWSTKLPSYASPAKKKDPITWKGPVLANGRLAVVGSNGQLMLISALDGKIAATQEIADDIYTAPVIAGGKMYLISKDATLYSLQ